MVRLYGLLSVLSFAFFLYCLLDVALSESSSVRNLPKLLWVAIVLLVPLAGGIAWLVAGRPEEAALTPGSTQSRRSGRGRDASSRGRRGGGSGPPLGPDDDPDFLRRIDEQLRRDDDSDAAD